jgi:Zn finger protein HypA/HybF involved in hydrogenase expression
MRGKREPKFFECADCKKVCLVGKVEEEGICPSCGSANGGIISSSELERRIEEGAVFNIDLSPRVRNKPRG